MAKEALIIKLQPKLQELRELNFRDDTLKEFLLAFARVLVPKWPEKSLREIIDNILK